MPALQASDPCQGGKKTTGTHRGWRRVQTRECVWRGVWGPLHSHLRRQCLRASGRGFCCFRRVGDRTGSGMCPWGLKGFSPVQGPYCQARSNCLSSSSSASSMLKGWGSSSAMTSCSSGLPGPVPCRTGPLPHASQLSYCSLPSTPPLPPPSETRPGVGSRGHTSLPLYCPRPMSLCVHSSRPTPHLRDLALMPAPPCCVQ